LLLDRKLKNPSNEDEEVTSMRSRIMDAPRKRVDKFKTSNGLYNQLTIGSPVVGRRGLIVQHGPRHQSCHTTPLQSPCTSPIVSNKELAFLRDQTNQTTPTSTQMNAMSNENDNNSSSSSSSNVQQQIRSRINSFKMSMFTTPKFYRRKMVTPEKMNPSMNNTSSTTPTTNVTPSLINNNNNNNNNTNNMIQMSNGQAPNTQPTPTQSNGNETPILDSKSWFQRWNFRQENINTQPQIDEKDKEFTFYVNDRPLNSVKADLIHAFLSTQDLIHNINSPSLFRCEYRSPDKFLARNVRFKVEILPDTTANANNLVNGANVLTTNMNSINISNNMNNTTSSTNGNSAQLATTPTTTQSYKILFTLINGSTKQFHQLCKHICSLISLNYSSIYGQRNRQAVQQQQQLQQQQPQQVKNAANSITLTSQINQNSNKSVGNAPQTPIMNQIQTTPTSTNQMRFTPISNSNGSTSNLIGTPVLNLISSRRNSQQQQQQQQQQPHQSAAIPINMPPSQQPDSNQQFNNNLNSLIGNPSSSLSALFNSNNNNNINNSFKTLLLKATRSK